MNHSFDVEIATEYGVNCAIILENLYFWTEHNRANGKHFHDGYYWTYNSVRAFKELFPYLGSFQIRNAIDKLKSEGLILTGNYNEDMRDRTVWYALTEKANAIFGNRNPHLMKPQSSFDETAKCLNLNNINIHSETDINTDSSYCSEPLSGTSEPQDGFPAEPDDPLADVVPIPLNDNTEYQMTQKKFEEFSELYPAVDVAYELRKMRMWCENKPHKRKTRKGVNAFINTWLSKEQDRGGTRGYAYAPPKRKTEADPYADYQDV